MDLDRQIEEQFNKIENGFHRLFHRLIERGFDREWFTWLEWTMIGAGVYAIAVHTGSTILFCIATLSGLLLFFRAMHVAEGALQELVPSLRGRTGALVIAGIAVALVPATAMLTIGKIFVGFIPQ